MEPHLNCRCSVFDAEPGNNLVFEDTVEIWGGRFVPIKTPTTVYVEDFDAEVCHTNPWCDEINGKGEAYAKRDYMTDCEECEDWP